MTILYGDTGRASMGTFKKVDFFYPKIENNLVTSDLPLAKSGTPTFSFTIDSSVIPITSSPVSFIYVPWIVAGGKNNNASAVTINYEVYRNGVLWQSGNKTGVTASQYWTFYFMKYDTTFCQGGDVIDVYLWANLTGVSYYYNAVIIMPSRNDYGAKYGSILKDFSYTATSPIALLTGATGGGAKGSSNLGIMYAYTSNTTTLFTGTTSSYTINAIQYGQPTHKLGSLQNGDFQGGTGAGINVQATNMPHAVQNSIPSSVSFREISL